MGNMILKAETNKVKSKCECDLPVTKQEWDAMTEDERRDLIDEYMDNVVCVWVEEEE